MQKASALFTFTSALFQVAQAQTEAEWFKYHEFATGMAYWGYTWEAFELTTDDGFVLTTFHVTGKKD